MENNIFRKRYNLKPPVNPFKTQPPAIKCPRCHSANVKTRSRDSYFLRAAVCLVLILICQLAIESLKQENDIDRVIILGVLTSAAISALTLIFGLYYLICGLINRGTVYACCYCKYKFHHRADQPRPA